MIASLTSTDVDEGYIRWWNDPEIQQGLNQPVRHWGFEQARTHVARFDDHNRFHLGIRCRRTTRLVGFISLFVEPRARVASTNIVIGEKEYWGRGVPLEVRGRMLQFLFRRLGVEKVKGTVYGRNLPSIFNYKAAGFRCEGILRADQPAVWGDGRVDVYLFGLLRDEWEARLRAAADSAPAEEVRDDA